MGRLDDLFGRIEKRFGKEALVGSNVEVETVSSGSLALDEALGGGWALGRIHECFGNESSGKCVSKDGYVLTAERGWQSIEDIFNMNGLEILTTNKVVEKSFGLINCYGEKEDTVRFTYNGKKPLYKIRTKSGFEHKITAKHPLMVLSENGFPIWKWAQEIREGDILLGIKNSVFGNFSIEKDKAYFIGLLLADGSVGDTITFTNDDKDIKSFIENLNYPIWGLSHVRSYPNKESLTSVNYQFSCVSSWNETKDILFLPKKCTAGTKSIHSYLMGGNEETVRSLLQGYMDCEGYFAERHLEVTSKSKKLLYQVKLLLTQFGIKSYLDQGMHVKGYEDLYYRLSIYSEDYLKYKVLIGTRSSYREQQMSGIKVRNSTFPKELNPLFKALFDSWCNRSIQFSLIRDSFSKGLGQNKENFEDFLECLEKQDNPKIIQDLIVYVKSLYNKTFDEVVSIEKIDEEPTFDFEMQRTHTFLADGSINHNTSCALHLCASVQKNLGKAIGYVDVEQALDLDYAKKLGIDLDKDNWILSQPNSAEEAMEIVREMLECPEIGLVVLDSVAGLVPQATLQGESGDAKVALVARLLSTQLSILKNVCKKNNNILFCINQLREKVGGGFGFGGATTMTPGGKALKFYATQRAEFARIGTDKSGDVAVANKTKIKITKNKIAPPFRSCDVMLRFGVGFDVVQEVVEIAVKKGICQKKGSWFYYGDDYRLGQGMDSVREELLQDTELFNEIKEQVKQALCTQQD